jgi:hypothetical protein
VTVGNFWHSRATDLTRGDGPFAVLAIGLMTLIVLAGFVVIASMIHLESRRVDA